MPSQAVQEVLSRLKGVRPSGKLKWEAYCPAHEDSRQSLSIAEGADGRALIYCHAGCNNLAVVRSIGLTLRALFPDNYTPRDIASKITVVYNYVTADGELAYQVCRMDPKDFRQRCPDGHGGWIWKAPTEKLLYRLPELLAADPNAPVFIVEGEKDVDNLRSLGKIATCSPGGAGKWDKVSDTSALAGRHLVIIADKDEPGRKHAQQVARRQQETAASIRVIEMPGESHKDFSDWLSTQRLGGASDAEIVARLDELVNGARKPTIPPAANPAMPPKSDDNRWILSSKRPYGSALAFLADFHQHPDRPTLLEWDGSFFRWGDANCWKRIEDTTLGAKILPWLHEAKTYNAKKEEVWFSATSAAVESIIKCLRWTTHSPDIVRPPAYLGGNAPYPVTEILPCKSFNLHIPTRTKIAPTPNLFVTNALSFDYDPNAPIPVRWLNFLNDILDGDEQMIALLQEWFGYCLTPDMSRQKALLFIGPPRSGKGTVARILAAMLGVENVCTPTIQSLAGQYGFDALQDRLLAIITDARWSHRDAQSVVEKLLPLIGGDPVDIERKYQRALTSVSLHARVMMISNELPHFYDASTAMATRFVAIKTTVSHLGREDLTLEQRLMQEMPGILNWAIDGWQRLQKQQYFTEPNATKQEIDDLIRSSSPITAFVRECCVLGEDEWVDVGLLWEAWEKWSRKEGYRDPGVRQWLGRRLRSAFPNIKLDRESNGQRGRFYTGIGLKSDAGFIP
jgi:putative DNA primase/helicase